MLKLKKLIPLFIISVFVFSNSALIAQGKILKDSKKNQLQQNVNTVSAIGDYSQTDTLEGIIARIIRIVLSVLGTIFIFLMFLAGQAWMRAEGNEQVVNDSKEKIQSLIIGLIIVLGAYALSAWISKVFANLIEL